MSNFINKNTFPIIDKLKTLDELVWINPNYIPNSFESGELSYEDILDTEKRLKRFSPFFMSVFEDTKKTDGIIESNLTKIENFRKTLFDFLDEDSLYMKCDNLLPIAGSIKARGGIYEVIKHAEDLAIKNNLISHNDNYNAFSTKKFKDFFSDYSITVGSTGNLGLSIGIISSKLGFKVNVHMSSDAKKWKKDLLRTHGVNVIEHNTDYTLAVIEGRLESQKNPNDYFIDDENSKNLFLGYAVAALRLKNQLFQKNITIDSKNPLLVYLPCGVGGGPGGVLYGLKKVFGENIHCFFVEPTHSPCMLLGMATGLHDKISVQDIGIDNITEADGLAVGKPSAFVGKTIFNMLSGISTVDDKNLFRYLALLIDTESIFLEPSAIAGASSIKKVFSSLKDINFISEENFKKGTHIIWATGGSLVPKSIMSEYYNKGKALL